MNNIFVRFTFLFLVMIIVTACQKAQVPEEQVEEKSSQVEIATVSQNEDRQIVMNPQGGVPIPDSWPIADIIYSSGDIILSEVTDGSQKIVVKTIDSVDVVRSWLISAMQRQNMNNDSDTTVGNSWMATFSNNDYKVALLVLQNNDETKINYTLVEDN